MEGADRSTHIPCSQALPMSLGRVVIVLTADICQAVVVIARPIIKKGIKPMLYRRLHHLPLFVFPLVLFSGLFGFVSVASAHSVAASKPVAVTSFDPEQFCQIPSDRGIEITGRNGLLNTPITTITVSPCYLFALVSHKEVPAQVIQHDSNLSDTAVQLLQKAVIFHAQELWTKDLSCPQPENGVSFSIVTPSWLTLGFTPTPTIDTMLLLQPLVVCE